MRSVYCLSTVLNCVLLIGGSPAGAQEGAAPDAPLSATATEPALDVRSWDYLPGEFAIRTPSGNYATALGGGGLASEPSVASAATYAKPWEKFRIAVANPAPPHDKAFQTSGGNYITAVGGGGRISDVLHTDATQIRDWERFRIYDLSGGGVAPTWFAIQTIRGNYLTAVGQGGKYEDAFHTDASVIASWEHLRLVKCGDIGTGYAYTILPADDIALTAVNGGGLNHDDPIVRGSWPGDTPDRSWSRFTFLQQSDGTYALQTANGVNYLTALGGGGLVQKYYPPDCGLFEACIAGFSRIFHTDATQVLDWEKFRIIDQGNCKYAIQTTSGFFVGIFEDASGGTLLTTRRSEISENEKFQLIMRGLASPLVIQ
jgi:hypothetical protein